MENVQKVCQINNIPLSLTITSYSTLKIIRTDVEESINKWKVYIILNHHDGLRHKVHKFSKSLGATKTFLASEG
jgi:hypothetical protein